MNNEKNEEIKISEEMETALAALAGQSLSKWFPRGIVRKVLMAVFLFIGFQGFLTGNYLYFLSFFLLEHFLRD